MREFEHLSVFSVSHRITAWASVHQGKPWVKWLSFLEYLLN